MPLIRCRNFDDNGSRKTWPNGSEMQCRPGCQFVHPSEPSWDRAPSALPREGGGPPRGGRGRGRGQSSFRAPATGANSFSLGRERRGSSGAWDDYMTSNAPATSSGWGAPPTWGGQTTAGTSGWGGADASGSGWGSSDNNTADTANARSIEPAAWGEQASSSQWDNQATGWGSSDNAWGSTGTNLGPGWGEDSFLDQGSKTAAVDSVASPVGPNTLARTSPSENPGAVTGTTSSSRAMQSNTLPSKSDTTLNEQHGEDAQAIDVSHTEPKAPSSATLLRQSSAIKSKKTQVPHGDPDNRVVSASSDVDKTSYLALYTAMTSKIRELDTELSQLSVMRKSSQVAATRAARGLLRKTVHEVTDARVAVEAERGTCSRKLTQSNFAFLPPVQHVLATLDRDNGQLGPFKDWVSRAEQCLNHVQAEDSPITPVERSNGATFISKLNQLQGRSESLGETDWQCQDLQLYSAFLDNIIQQKKDHIVAAMVKNHNATYNDLLSTALSTLQRQGEVWNQVLEIQAGKFAQTLLQSDQLNEDRRSRPVLKAESQSTIQQLQVDVIQRKLQLQAVQEEITQLQHILTSIKQQQQSYLTVNTVENYTSHIQGYIQGYIQANATPSMKAVLRSTVAQFTTTELRTVEKVWKTLHPLIQISLWLQQLNINKTEEEMEIREIEESLLV